MSAMRFFYRLVLVVLVWLLAATPAAACGPLCELTPESETAQDATVSDAGSDAEPAVPPVFEVEAVASGLTVPWALAWDGQGDLYFTERPGRLRVVRDGALDPEPVATFDVVQSGEGGLLGLVLDPAFAQNGYLYVMYSMYEGGGTVNRISRMTLVDGVASDELILVDDIPGGVNHDGGRLAIGPDEKLYATTGDAWNHALPQDPNSLAGKILRLELDGSAPADNPTPGSLVYSQGHRNPQGLAWQPETDVLWSTEHGPSGEFGQCCQDELNRIVPGADYGWPTVTTGSDDPRYVHPVLHSGTSDTWAPGGLAFYHGDDWPQWYGDAFISGLRGARIIRVELGGPELDTVVATEDLLAGEYGRIREVTMGPDGLLYFTTSNQDGRGRPAPDDDIIARLVPVRHVWLSMIAKG